jgi:HEAT repeat protein
MKASIKQTALLLTLFFVLVAGINQNLSAQPNPISHVTKNEHALDNLKAGINSENAGVRKSSIYFAGKYRIAEVAKTLVERLEKEEEPSIRLLIAYALYEMKDAEGMKAIKELSLNDKDLKVRRMSFNLYNEYLNNSSLTAAL